MPNNVSACSSLGFDESTDQSELSAAGEWGLELRSSSINAFRLHPEPKQRPGQ